MNDNVEQILAAISALSEEKREQLFDRLASEMDFSPSTQKAAPPQYAYEELEDVPNYTIIFDGGSKGNPGPGYGSYALRREQDSRQRIVRFDFDREMTNNEAEYESLIAGLQGLIGRIESFERAPQEFTLEVRGDSALVLNQVKGSWKARDDRMRALRDRARNLLERFEAYRLVHQDREESVRILGH